MIDEIFGTRISCIETRHMPPFIAIPTCRDVCRTCLSSFSLALFERADLYLRHRTSSHLHLRTLCCMQLHFAHVLFDLVLSPSFCFDECERLEGGNETELLGECPPPDRYHNQRN